MYHPGFFKIVIIVLLLLLSLSLIALVSYCVFYCNLLFSYSATQPQVWNKLSQSVSYTRVCYRGCCVIV